MYLYPVGDVTLISVATKSLLYSNFDPSRILVETVSWFVWKFIPKKNQFLTKKTAKIRTGDQQST